MTKYHVYYDDDDEGPNMFVALTNILMSKRHSYLYHRMFTIQLQDTGEKFQRLESELRDHISHFLSCTAFKKNLSMH